MNKMTDEQMIEYLRNHAHWTTTRPWKDIADRLEELVNENEEKRKDTMNGKR